MFKKNHISFVTRSIMILALLAGLLGATPVKPASAATIVVNSVSTLLTAFNTAANGDTIKFAPSLAGQTLTLPYFVAINSFTHFILDGSGLSPQVTIDGAGTGGINFNGSSSMDIYNVTFSRFSEPIVFRYDTTIKNSTFKNFTGGVIRATATLTISDSTFINNGGNVITSQYDGAVSITNTTIRDNNGSVFIGGSPSSLTINNSVITNNTSGTIIQGAAITITDSTLAGNHGELIIATASPLMIANTAIYQNDSQGSSAIILVNGNVTVTIVNSTFTENQTRNNEIFINGGATIDILNSTIIGSTSRLFFVNGGVNFGVYNSIVLCTHQTECMHSFSSINQSNSIVGVNGTLAEYGLTAIANNDGPTKTMALLSNSPLIDAGDDTVCANEYVNNLDQRGKPRPEGEHCDIGAYEYQLSVIYVNDDATGANNGTSWTDAYTSLQSALSTASIDNQIWVAAGTYKPTTTTDRTISFNLKNGVAVYGGFAGTETLRSQRNIQTNVTTLSGDIGVAGNNSDNSYHVVVGSNTDNTALLDGFTVTGGNANGTTMALKKGGGMYTDLGSPTVQNTVFSNNYAAFGAGMYNYGDQFEYTGKYFTPTLTNVIFRNNSAEEGGGLRNEHYSSPILTNVTFDGNSVIRGGGGMENFNYCNPTLTNVTFSNNSSIDGNGGGILNWIGNNPSLTNVTFSGNIAEFAGGGMANYSSNPTIRNTILWGNTAADGAQIYSDTASIPVISDSVVQGGYVSGTNIITADPMLGILGNYGGFTQTIPLMVGSSAIDAGEDGACPATDQRGVARPKGEHCDIGAYEYPFSVIYVNANAAGANNGLYWSDAYTDLQSALSTASSGNEIWVAAGTYKPTTTIDRTISFNLKNGVAVYGGFAGTEAFRSQRNVQSNVTTLSGDIGVTGNTSDNSYHVAVGSNTDNTALLDGFTVTDGNANGTLPYNSGGGMFNNSGNPTLSNLIFTTNSAGAGAGMSNENDSNPVLTNATFDGNTSTIGGGMYNTVSSPTLTNVTFSNNSAVYYGGGMYNVDNPSPSLTDVTFINNSAQFGGGIYNIQGNPSMTNATFTGNSAEYGGGIYNIVSNPILTNVILWGDTATNGSEVYNDASVPIIGYSVVQGGCPAGSTCTNIITTDPMLGTLGNYSGFTQTIPLLAGSSAIDAGNDGNCPATDQRGVARPYGSHCDIGAYEVNTLTPIAPLGVMASWNNNFNWIGTSGATNYQLEVYNTDTNTLLYRKWLTAGATNCDTDLSCTYSPAVLSTLPNGNYNWRVQHFVTNYGLWTPYMNFSVNAACYSLTTATGPSGKGTFNVTSPNCGVDQYTAGTVVQITSIPNAGFSFVSWSGDAGGVTSTTSVTMDGNKSVTANLRGVTLLSPSGEQTSWTNAFDWTGTTGATNYQLEVYNTDTNTLLYRKWLTAGATGCDTDLSCTYSPAVLSTLPNGNYNWRVQHFVTSYGLWTPYTAFSVNVACYTLTSRTDPVGSGTFSVTSPNCGVDQYTAGTVVQITSIPNAGFSFVSWSGDASGISSTTSVTMNGDKSVTANLRGVTLLNPSGVQGSWVNAFNWTGATGATGYQLEVYNVSTNALLYRKWLTATETNCDGDLSCTYSPSVLSTLPNGDYRWRVQYYAGGYGLWSPYSTFSVNALCYTLTTNSDPANKGTFTVTTPNCEGTKYTAGSVVQVTIVPNNGFAFLNWSGDASGISSTTSVKMNGDKSVTANLRGVTLLNPSGGQGSWVNAFNWTGATGATGYQLEVYNVSTNALLYRKWLTVTETNCDGDLSCTYSPSVLSTLPNGDYRWRVQYYAGGYGLWSPYSTFSTP